MTERVATCMGCNGPIEDLADPGVVKATKSTKPPTLSGRLKEAGDDVAYFHAGCFRSQFGYEPV